jgi:hypothetical protein
MRGDKKECPLTTILSPDGERRCVVKHHIKGSSKNVIPAKAGIHNMLKFLDSRLRRSDRM